MSCRIGKWNRNTPPEAFAELAGDEWYADWTEADGDSVQARKTVLSRPR